MDFPGLHSSHEFSFCYYPFPACIKSLLSCWVCNCWKSALYTKVITQILALLFSCSLNHLKDFFLSLPDNFCLNFWDTLFLLLHTDSFRLFFFYFLVFFKSFHDSTFEPKQLWLESKHGWMKTKGHNQIKWYKCKQYLKSQIQINIKTNWNDTSCKGKATGEHRIFLETAKTGLILRVWICNITTNMAAPQI